MLNVETLLPATTLIAPPKSKASSMVYLFVAKNVFPRRVFFIPCGHAMKNKNAAIKTENATSRIPLLKNRFYGNEKQSHPVLQTVKHRPSPPWYSLHRFEKNLIFPGARRQVSAKAENFTSSSSDTRPFTTSLNPARRWIVLPGRLREVRTSVSTLSLFYSPRCCFINFVLFTTNLLLSSRERSEIARFSFFSFFFRTRKRETILSLSLSLSLSVDDLILPIRYLR